MRRCMPRIVWTLLLMAVVLSGCSRPSLEPVGAISIAQYAKDQMEEIFFNGGYTYFDTHEDHVGILQDARLPEWAKDTYDACVYWEDGFISSHRSLPGQNVRGDAWGWILVNKELETFVVELSYRRDDSDETVTLIDRWAGPDEEI